MKRGHGIDSDYQDLAHRMSTPVVLAAEGGAEVEVALMAVGGEVGA